MFFTLLLSVLLNFIRLSRASGTTACISDTECTIAVGDGSVCIESLCSNPFRNGCLHERLGNWTKQRVCNSDDTPEAEEMGICIQNPFDYMELRIFESDFDSGVFLAWILQIVLSELLDVPTSVENGLPEAYKMNFYYTWDTFQFGIATDRQSLIRANDLIDCRLADELAGTYDSCAHFVPSFWSTEDTEVQNMIFNGTVDLPRHLGVIGQEALFIPKFTAERDPTLLSYIGMAGEENRIKLAETFLRPTTWKAYCEIFSPVNCTSDDGVAKRAPVDETEYDRMFFEGMYKGYFRPTPENNCTLNNATCTGHVADYPCGWGSPVQNQMYYLDIALQSSGDEPNSHGYTYNQLKDIWKAANATKSDVIMMWYYPEKMFQQFLGTDAEFQQVLMPPATQKCQEARLNNWDQCSADFNERVGESIASCSEFARAITKLTSGSLADAIYDPSIPKALINPGNEVFQRFKLSSGQQESIFQYLNTFTNPRDAACSWAVDHLDYLQSLVPNGYPRKIVEIEQVHYMYASTIAGIVSLLFVFGTIVVVFIRRKTKAIRFAQMEFLCLLLAGSLMIALGAIVTSLPPSTNSCTAGVWLINIGYTLELVPLVVKIAAINRLMSASRRLKRIVLKRRMLYGAVFCICAVMVAFLIVWSLVDPPSKEAEYQLKDNNADDGYTNVELSYYCQSGAKFWNFIAVGWNGFLLLCASVLAFQSRKVREDFNESQTLAFLIYSHFLFMVFRLVTYFLEDYIKQSLLDRVRSIIFSTDTVANMIIYFFPKLFSSPKSDDPLPSDISRFWNSRSSMQQTNQPNRPFFAAFPAARFFSSITMVSHHEPAEDASDASMATDNDKNKEVENGARDDSSTKGETT